MEKKIKTILIVLAVTVAALGVGYGALRLTAIQSRSNPSLAKIKSLASAEYEVWFLEEGPGDRGITLFVKSPSMDGGRPRRVTELDWSKLYAFEELRWSDDGQLAVFFLSIAGGDPSGVVGFAFDFSSNQIYVPPWQSRVATERKTLAEWKEYEKTIMAVAKTHGGLVNYGVSREDIKSCQHKIYFWQIPK
jgi:hypothetical protein